MASSLNLRKTHINNYPRRYDIEITFNVGFGVLRISTAHCISVVGAFVVGTIGSSTVTDSMVEDLTGREVASSTRGGGSANSNKSNEQRL